MTAGRAGSALTNAAVATKAWSAERDTDHALPWGGAGALQPAIVILGVSSSSAEMVAVFDVVVAVPSSLVACW